MATDFTRNYVYIYTEKDAENCFLNSNDAYKKLETYFNIKSPTKSL